MSKILVILDTKYHGPNSISKNWCKNFGTGFRNTHFVWWPRRDIKILDIPLKKTKRFFFPNDIFPFYSVYLSFGKVKITF